MFGPVQGEMFAADGGLRLQRMQDQRGFFFRDEGRLSVGIGRDRLVDKIQAGERDRRRKCTERRKSQYEAEEDEDEDEDKKEMEEKIDRKRERERKRTRLTGKERID